MVKRKQRRKIDHEKFVREWQLAVSVAEVAERMDVPSSTVHAVARRLRDAGVHIKQMPRNPIDVKKLNEIIEGLE